MLKAGTWRFVDIGTGAQTLTIINDASAGKIKAAFQAAQTTLGGAVDQLIGYDPSGRPTRYTGTKLNANMTA